VFEKRVLRRIFGRKSEELAEGWRRLHNEELHNLYASPNIIRMIKWRIRLAERVARMGEMRNACNILVGKPEGKRSLSRKTWDNIKMNIREIEWEVLDRIYLAQDRGQWLALVNTVMILECSIKVTEFLD
jgi:hypothetical protein